MNLAETAIKCIISFDPLIQNKLLNITLTELKISAYLYTAFSDEDRSYKNLADKNLNLAHSENRDLLINFLRSWGCRQFKREDHNLSSKSLKDWYKKHHEHLPAPNKSIITASNKQIRSYGPLFNDLMLSIASFKVNSGVEVPCTIGPVGAAKALFALRKNMFAPWDNPIINELPYNKDGKGYCDYLVDVKRALLDLEQQCRLINVNIYKLPAYLNRPYTSLPKLIDEYLWVNITRGCVGSKILELIKS